MKKLTALLGSLFLYALLLLPQGAVPSDMTAYTPTSAVAQAQQDGDSDNPYRLLKINFSDLQPKNDTPSL